MRAVRHLVKNKLGHYYVRVYVPKDLREIIKKKELRRSLRTTCEATAYRLSFEYVDKFQRYFQSLRKEHGMFNDVFYNQMISIGNLTKIFPDGRKEIAENVTLDGEIEEKYLTGMIGNDVSKRIECSDEVADNLVEPVLDAGNSAKATVGDLSKVNVFAIKRPLFSEVVERIYRARKRKIEQAGEDPDTRWFNDYKLIKRVLIESIGDKFIDEYTEADAEQFFDDLSGLPLRYTSARKWRKVPLREVVDNPNYSSEEGMSDSRLYDLEVRTNAIFSDAVKLGKLKYSVFREFIREKPDSNSYEPFTGLDLRKLFDARVPLSAMRPSHYWVPLIALFTGMRRSEIFYRVADDIRKDDDGIWYIEVHRRNGSRTKTKTSVRKLPIHSKLIDLGFIDYVLKVADRDGGDARLFPEYNDCKGSYNQVWCLGKTLKRQPC